VKVRDGHFELGEILTPPKQSFLDLVNFGFYIQAPPCRVLLANCVRAHKLAHGVLEHGMLGATWLAWKLLVIEEDDDVVYQKTISIDLEKSVVSFKAYAQSQGLQGVE
jgi:hypothetical protein